MCDIYIVWVCYNVRNSLTELKISELHVHVMHFRMKIIEQLLWHRYGNFNKEAFLLYPYFLLPPFSEVSDYKNEISVKMYSQYRIPGEIHPNVCSCLYWKHDVD